MSSLPPQAPRAAARRPPQAYLAEFDLSPDSVRASADARAPAVQPALPGGPPSPSALDLERAPGRGGERASERAALLFSFVSPLTLQDTELNNLARNQTQRIETARTRATQEERRATPHAADAVFLASGARGHRERRTPARTDARDGARRGQGEQGGARGPLAEAAANPGGAAALEPAQQLLAQGAPSRTPSAADAPAARGILRGAGQRASAAAKVEYARPNVDPGPAATPALALDARVRDNADAELLAAALQRSIVDSSAQRAEQRGPGAGGAEDPSGHGSGPLGLGSGARALPYTPGLGDAAALDTRDARYVRWFVEQKERVQNELIFPRPRALAKDQGVSIYRVVVRRDGQLASTPRLVRSSGYADFDQAAVIAIRRATPFTPLPERLLPDAGDVTLLIPVAFSNPMVQ